MPNIDKTANGEFCNIYERIAFLSLEGTREARIEMAGKLNILLLDKTQILNQLILSYGAPEITVFRKLELDGTVVEQAKYALTAFAGFNEEKFTTLKYKPSQFVQLSLREITNTTHDIKLSNIINSVRNAYEHAKIKKSKNANLRALEMMRADDPDYKIIQYIADSILGHLFSLYVNAKLEDGENSLLYCHKPPSEDRYIHLTEGEYLTSKALSAKFIDKGYTFMLALDLSNDSQQSPLPTIFSVRFFEYPMFKENPCFEISILKDSRNRLLVRFYCNGYEYMNSNPVEVTTWHSIVISIREIDKKLKILLSVDGRQSSLERNIPISLKEAKYVTTTGANQTKTNQSILSVGLSVGVLGFYYDKIRTIESVVKKTVKQLRVKHMT